MNRTTVFRAIVVAEWVFAVASTSVDNLTRSSLPPALLNYATAQQDVLPLGGHPVGLVFFVLLVATLFVASIGLYRFRAWAIKPYVAASLAGLALGALRAPFVAQGFSDALINLCTMSSGAIVTWILVAPSTLPFTRRDAQRGQEADIE